MGHIEVGYADAADEALVAQFDQCLPAAFEVALGERTMNLVQVDPVDPEAREAGLELAPDGIGCEIEHDLAGAVDARPTLRKDQRTSSSRTRDSAPDDRFGVSPAVRSRGVDPVDAELEGPFDGGERVAVLLVGPAATPL